MFIQPCYIRRNTPRLIRELENLGYQKFAKLSDTLDSIYCWDSFYATKDYADVTGNQYRFENDRNNPPYRLGKICGDTHRGC